MATSTKLLRDHAREIWQAGVAAVDSEHLVRQAVTSTPADLTVCGEEISLKKLRRLAVVGAGKAGAGMAKAFEDAVGETGRQKLTGWVNVPEDCVSEGKKIHLHAARPAGVNEPTEAGVEGAERILQMVGELTPDDVCVVLLSGGGSALLPAPAEGISLSDKQSVTRMLMHSGATIGELNAVRKQLSRIKGGRLAAATNAGLVIALIISDVIGDPLDVIASGPTVPDPSTPRDALDVLERFDPDRETVPASVWSYLESRDALPSVENFPADRVQNHVIGNNQVALDAARRRAEALGYRVDSLGSENAEEARVVGRDLAQLARKLRSENSAALPVCVLSGGEPVVHLAATDQPRKGGRNQEVALAALIELWDEELKNVLLLSGGTDGEDGPTDAAGAFADAEVREAAIGNRLDPAGFLAINNSYPFFEQTGGLLKTGPTHTNVMDLRVMIVAGSVDFSPL